MPEILANKFDKGNIYSTTEKIVGQWTDGKPLYQKTINYGKITTAHTDKAHGISNIDTVVKLDGMWIQNDNGNYYVGPCPAANPSGSTVCYSYASKTNITIDANGGFIDDKVTYIFTIQYTKTTDSVLPMGVDTDYSTTEKIIGTWIDGKPIYQKTFTGTITTKGDNVIVNDNKLNLIGIVNSYLTKDGWTPILPYLYGTGSDLHYAIGFVQDDNKRISLNYTDIGSGDYYIGATYYITLQYTKTTD